jgi:sec-independent protein translocase protein TatA
VIGDILQPTHLLFILVVALLVLGPKRLPEVGRALGRGMRDFKSALSGDLLSGEDREEVPPETGPLNTPPPQAAPGPVVHHEPPEQPEHHEPPEQPEQPEPQAHAQQPEPQAHAEQPEHVA